MGNTMKKKEKKAKKEEKEKTVTADMAAPPRIHVQINKSTVQFSLGGFHGQANSATNSHKQLQTTISTIHTYIRGIWYLE